MRSETWATGMTRRQVLQAGVAATLHSSAGAAVAREFGDPSTMGSTPVLTRFDPWGGMTPESTFAFAGSDLPPGDSRRRLESREMLA